jgi:hypothetical protein
MWRSDQEVSNQEDMAIECYVLQYLAGTTTVSGMPGSSRMGRRVQLLLLGTICLIVGLWAQS